MKKLRILVDYDEVLNNLLDAWVAYLNNRYNARARAEDINEWDLQCIYPSLTQEEVNRPLVEDGFWKTLVPKQFSVNSLKEMIDDGHEIFIVTAASVYQSIPAKMDWLFENYPYLSWENIVIATKKQIITGDVLIDDGVHNLEGGSYFKILFESYNNRVYNAEANGMVRVYSLKEAYEIIKTKFTEE